MHSFFSERVGSVRDSHNLSMNGMDAQGKSQILLYIASIAMYPGTNGLISRRLVGTSGAVPMYVNVYDHDVAMMR